MFNTEISNKYELVIGSGLFPEVWTANVVLKWGANLDELDYHIDHIEFRSNDGKAISDTGYRSEFTQITGDIGEFVKSLAEALAQTKVLNFKEVK